MGTENNSQNNYFDQLKNKMDSYAHFVYKITRDFPKEELYGCTSQFRRATLSVVLNFIEGYARRKVAVKRNFWEISYGSLQESKYLVGFTFAENYMTKDNYEKAQQMAEEIGAMLWRALEPISNVD